MFRRWISTLRSWLGSEPGEVATDSKTEIRVVIDDALMRDQELRNEAAKLIARKIVLGSHLGRAAEELGRSEEMARAATEGAREALASGSGENAAKWAEAARRLAVRSRSMEEELTRSLEDYESALVEADRAREALAANTARARALGSEPGEGPMASGEQLAEIDMAVQVMSTSIDDQAPDLDRIQQMIETKRARGRTEAHNDGLTLDVALRTSDETANMNGPGAGAEPDDLRGELGP